jgi:hypothetical protein
MIFPVACGLAPDWGCKGGRPLTFEYCSLYASGMEPRSLEAFIEDAFGGVQPTSTAISRVAVDPNYTAIADELELSRLAHELVRCIRAKTPNLSALRSPQGHDIPISDNYPMLRKYLRTITLYGEVVIGPWVQVEPPESPSI